MIKIGVFYLLFWAVICSAQPSVNQSNSSCGTLDQTNELAQLIINHPNQDRPLLQCNQQLSTIAQQRAEQLANNSSEPNITPNQALIKGGFRVPNYYPVTGNQVEAVAKDYKQAKQAFQYLTQSNKHHDHVLGKGEFFGLQNQMGIGYYQANDEFTKTQWVVLIAEQWQPPKVTFNQEFNMPVKIAKGCETDWKNSNDEFLKRKCGSMGSFKKD